MLIHFAPSLHAAFPFWESQAIDDAVPYLEAEMDPIFAQSNGKAFILGETGWPSNGTSDQTSVPSPANQAQYLQDFYCRMDRQLGWAYYYFTGIDNSWRLAQDGQEDSVEAHFGLLNPDLTLKDFYKDFTFTCPDSDVEYSIQLGSGGGVSVPTAPTASAPTASRPVPTASVPTPTVAATPSKPAPTATLGNAPTRRPSLPANIVSGVSSCSAYTKCFALELQGACCPTSEGVYLGCCEGGVIDSETDGGDSVPTAAAPTASTPTDDEPVPTASAPTAEVEPTAAEPTAFSPTGADSVPTAAEPTAFDPTDLTPTVGREDTEAPTLESTDDFASDAPSSTPTNPLDSSAPGETDAPTSNSDRGIDTSAISDNSGASSRSTSMFAIVGSLLLLAPALF